MLTLLLAFTLAISQQFEAPKADPRMLLEAPPPGDAFHREFMAIPPSERRAAFQKLPPHRQVELIATHLTKIMKRQRPRLNADQSKALSEFWNALSATARLQDAKSLARLAKLEKELLRLLPKSVVDEMHELLGQRPE